MSETTGKTALIVGASRGIGRGLAEELASRGWQVTGTVRKPGAAAGSVRQETLEINDDASVDAFVQRVGNERYDVVLINAGIAGDGETIADTRPEALTRIFLTNALSPVRLGERLLPLVKPGTGILAFTSSTIGSIARNEHLTLPIYGASKAALNHLTRSLAATRPDKSVTVLNVHPGWVKTDMGGENAEIDVHTSATGIADVLEREAGSGGQKFVDWRGQAVPW